VNVDESNERPDSGTRPASRRTRTRKKTEATQAGVGLIYAIASEEPGEGGPLQFVKRFELECDAVLESHRRNIPYYRIQKCVVKEDKANDSITLTGVPAQ
jgi:hypothetical protein